MYLSAAPIRSLNQLLVLTACLLAFSMTHANIIVDDSFDDGAIGTNTSGTGTGFASGTQSGGTVSEAGGVVLVDSPVNGGRRARIASNESASTTTTGGATFLFEDVNFAASANDSGDGSTHWTYLGIRGSSGASNAGPNPGEGFYVEFGFGGVSGNAAGTSTFFYNDASNVKTTLASWTFDTLGLLDAGVTNSELDITINVNATNWSLDIQGDTRDGGSPIIFSGTHAASSITNRVTTGYAFLHNQSESPNLEVSLGRVVINEIPTLYAHPGIGLTGADLDHIKARLTVEPWKTGYDDMVARSTASLSYEMQGPYVTVSHKKPGNPQPNDPSDPAWENDMEAVHNLARMWYFTDNAAYAQKARDILITWANNHTLFDAGEVYLEMGYRAHQVFEGVEILRGTWPGWTQTDTDTLKTYFETVWWNSPHDHLAVPDPLRSANQGMSQLAAALGVAVFLDDEVKFEQCLKAFRLDAPAALLSSLPNGQIGDSGRDAHDQGQLLLMAWCAEVFWMQGIDVFSEYDDRMLAAGEYFARQNLLIDTPFIQAGTVYDIYAEWHQFDGPYSNWGFESKMITILYNAYVVRKGMSAPYLEQLFNIAPQTDASFCHLMESDSSTAVAPAPMTGPAPVASVTTLSTTNMGDATNGSSSYDSGSDTWTVSGRGTSMWYSNTPDYRFSYLAVDGDATIIAQLTSLSGGSTDDARAGLVFSSDLTDTADMEAIIVTNPSGTDPQTYSFRRGDVTHSHQGNNGSRSYGRQGSPKVPYWFKIERIGNRVNTYSSPDGISWSCGESADYAVGTTAYYGLAVSSDQTNNTATATFTDVRITGGDGGEAEQTPEAPFAIYASPGGDQVPLRWLESFEADTYKIWRATQSGGPYTLVTQQAGTSYIDTGLVPGTYYYYAVSAVNAIGESTLSTEDVLAFPDTSWYEAEDHDSQMGTRLENARDFFGGQDVGYINDGEWLRYNDITLNTGAIFKARIAGFNENVGLIEVRSGSSTGTLLGSVNGVNTGGTQAWGTVETTLTVTPGVHDIFLVFKEVVVGQGPQMNINWFDIIDPAITEYELGKLASLTYDPAIHLLTNRSGVVDWDPSSVHLSLLDGSDLSDIDFSALGITSWTTTDFDNPALVTNWDGANLSGITLHSDGDFGANDSFTGADFSNVVWGSATSTADPAKFFSGGSGATSTATAANAIDFSGADLSLITGTARTTMINNLGAFDGGTPIGPIIDPTFIANSGWDSAVLIAAGWQYEVIDAYSIIQAEDYDNQYGVLIQNTSDTGGGLNLQAIDNGDWAAYYNVDFGSGADEFQARVASNNSGGNIEIRLGSPTGILIGTAIAPGTNNWQSYVTVTTSVSGASGVHDLYLVNTGGGGALFNLNWFKFNQAVVTHTLTYTAGVNGSITGSSPQVISDSGDGSSVTAVADAGYSFADWSDGNTDNPRTDTNVTNAITVSANFQAVPEKDAFAIIEAEDYDGQFGIDTQPSSEGGLNVQLIQNGDWTAYYNVDFGSSANEFQARVASYTSGGNIEIRLGGPTGILIGTAVVPTTGSWQEYVTVNTSITATSGLQNVYLVFTRSRGYLFNLNWFTFTNTYTLTYTAGANGSILGTSPQAVKSGANGTEVTAVPTAYYHFVDWSDGNTSASRTDLNVTGDITVSANFAITRTKLDNWRFIHFGTYDNTGNAADDFDADFDGIINLIEYATGTDPDSSSIASFTIQPSAGSGLEVSFNRILDHSLIYKVEGTDDLTSPIWNPVWTGTGSSAEEVIVPGSSWPSGPNYFLRLSVSVPE